MIGVIFPHRATVQLVDPGGKSIHVGGALVLVRLFATQKNDYELGPFVTDEQGAVTIDRAACERFVVAEQDSGLMDYAGIGACSADVEIRLASPEEIARAATSRRTVWRELLRGEREIFGSMESLLALYEHATNHRLLGHRPVIVPWNGASDSPSYSYVIERVAPA